jgi:dTDP-4-dehydrorhamnose 3,5-epimerase
MNFTATPIPGVVEIATTPHSDARGSFARLFCPDEFAAAGIVFTPNQINLSTNPRRHTLRGLHFQHPPFAEAKLVRAVVGQVWDVAVDLRPGPGFGRWHGMVLDAGAMNAVFLPEGVAHGFLTLCDGAQVLYQMGRAHVPGKATGVRWDDPALGIEWPAAPALIGDADLAWPLLADRVDLVR